MRRPRLARLLGSADGDVPASTWLVAWFVVVLVPTLALKAALVRALTNGDLDIAQLTAGEPLPAWWLFVAFLFPADVVEAAFVAGVLALPMLVAPRRARGALALMLTALLLLVGGLEWLALRELGALLTPDTVNAALGWALTSLSAVPAFVTPGRLLGVLAALLWLATPVVFPRLFVRAGRQHRALRVGIPILALAIVVAAGVRAGDALAPGRHTSPFVQGVWRSVALSLVRGDTAPPPDVAAAPDAAAVTAAYSRLAFPDGDMTPGAWVVDVPSSLRRPRHIVLVLLETAPQAYYDADRGDLPTLARLRDRAIVAERHYATAPMSSLALFSLLSGTYPRPGAATIRYGTFLTDSVPELLRRRGYETTHVDSYDLSWNGTHEVETIRALGISAVLDTRMTPEVSGPDPFARRVARDQQSFDVVRDRVFSAARAGRHAFVSLHTHLGHFDWLEPGGGRNSPPRARLAAAARALDDLIGRFLGQLEAAGLGDEVILVVTGDHGLRFTAEFEALGEPVHDGDAMYRVPMLIHAPALFDRTVRIPHVTSHVDLAPTLLDLTGTPRQATVHHGGNMLDTALSERVTFVASGAYPGLAPRNGLIWRGGLYIWFQTIDRVLLRAPGAAADEWLREGQGTSLTAADVRAAITRSQELFNETAALFLRRARAE